MGDFQMRSLLSLLMPLLIWATAAPEGMARAVLDAEIVASSRGGVSDAGLAPASADQPPAPCGVHGAFVDGPNLYAYVRQNPWTHWDPIGLESESERYWQGLHSQSLSGGHPFDALYYGLRGAVASLNPFDRDSSIRDGGRRLSAGVGNASNDIDKAPIPGALKATAKFSLGVGSAGAHLNPLLATSSLTETASAIHDKGVVAVAKEMAGAIAHDAVHNPSKLAGELLVVGASGNALKSVMREGTEIVQRAMSHDELGAMQDTGLVRGGRDGTHFVSDAVNSNAGRAQQRLSLGQTPDVRVTMEVPEGKFSAPSRVGPANGMPGGGMERTATGNIPATIKRVDEY